jgi:hypothetical protein
MTAGKRTAFQAMFFLVLLAKTETNCRNGWGVLQVVQRTARRSTTTPSVTLRDARQRRFFGFRRAEACRGRFTSVQAFFAIARTSATIQVKTADKRKRVPMRASRALVKHERAGSADRRRLNSWSLAVGHGVRTFCFGGFFGRRHFHSWKPQSLREART